LTETSTRKKLLVIVTIFLVVASIAKITEVKAQLIIGIQPGVHEYINSPKIGNYTTLDGPFFPVYFNSSQIPVGQNWTIECPLIAEHSYHIYFYGAWINTTSEAKTDYNVYVYNPQGILESTHTEAAGMPEHLGTTVDDPYFMPQQSGNYTFSIINDIKSTGGSQAATFMIIENAPKDKWNSQFIEGKTASGKNSKNTLWACEFVSNSPKIEVWVKVPLTLDMYEARLYQMNGLPTSNSSSVQKQNSTAQQNSSSLQSLNGIPLAWEPGLYANLRGNVGGYNFNSESYRGVAYASCEFMGQEMYLNYTRNSTALTLYHLAFIGQTGAGEIQFLIKTQFNNSALTPVSTLIRPETRTPTTITYALNSTQLEKATLNYTIDAWNHSSAIEMKIANNTCSADIPPQKAGSFVQYKIYASDDLKSEIEVANNFTVKNKFALNISLADESVELGKNVTFDGTIKFASPDTKITISFMSLNETQDIICTPSKEGVFNASFCPKTKGDWAIQASVNETQTNYGANAMVKVSVYQSFYSQNEFAIGGTAIAVVAVAMAFLAIKSRNR
jgi:hypothetical protein